MAIAKMKGATDGWPLPSVETTQDVVDYLNKESIARDAFKHVGYFVYSDVLVYTAESKERAKRNFDRKVSV